MRKQRQRLTFEEAQIRQPDLVEGQEWQGVGASYLYKCLVNPKHEPYQQRYWVHARSRGCMTCDVERRISEGSYFKNHNDSPENPYKNKV